MNLDLGDEMRELEERPAHPATPLQRVAYLLSGWMLLILPAAAVGLMGIGANGTLSTLGVILIGIPVTWAAAVIFWLIAMATGSNWAPKALGPLTMNLAWAMYAMGLATILVYSATPQFGIWVAVPAGVLWAAACMAAVLEKPPARKTPVTMHLRWLAPVVAMGVMGLSLAWNAPQPEETMRAVEQRVEQLETVEEVRARHAEGDMWGSPRMELYIVGQDANSPEEVQELFRETRAIIQDEIRMGDASIDYHQRGPEQNVSVNIGLGPYFDGLVDEIPDRFKDN